MAVKTDYEIKRAGKTFTVVDPWGERLVDVFPTEGAAQQDIERCQHEEACQVHVIMQ
jgi:hypothetical protein